MNVLNSAGQIVLTSQLAENREMVEVDFSNIESGFYFVVLITDNQVYITRITK